MSLYTDWSTALLDPRCAAPAGLVTWNGSDPAQRFAVYRNNVTLSLMEAIADTVPVCRAVVGTACFRDLALAFVRAHPPRSPVLMGYGATFPDFLAAGDWVGSRPYLPDLARLELACLESLYAAEAAPIDAEVLTALMRDAPERLPAVRLSPHPSLRAVSSDFAVVSLWAAYQDSGLVPHFELARPESAWVLRRERSVRVLPMARGDVRFVTALQAGLTLGEAAATAGTEADFDLTRCLTVLLREQALTDIHDSL
jgi:hypothetical protein